MKEAGQDQRLLAALHHPIRRAILREIDASEDPISPRQLAEKIGKPVSNTSYHIRILDECKAVKLIGTAPVRGTLQHFYVMTVEEPWALALLGLAESDGGDAEG